MKVYQIRITPYGGNQKATKSRQKLNWIYEEKRTTENHSDGGRNAERYGLSQD